MAADPAMTWSAPFRSTRRSAALPVDPDADRVDALICVDPRAARRARGHSTAHHGCGPLPRVRKPPRLPARPPAGWPGSARTRRRGAASLGRRRRPTVRSRAGRPPGRAPAYGRRQAAVLPPALARPVSRASAGGRLPVIPRRIRSDCELDSDQWVEGTLRTETSDPRSLARSRATRSETLRA